MCVGQAISGLVTGGQLRRTESIILATLRGELIASLTEHGVVCALACGMIVLHHTVMPINLTMQHCTFAKAASCFVA